MRLRYFLPSPHTHCIPPPKTYLWAEYCIHVHAVGCGGGRRGHWAHGLCLLVRLLGLLLGAFARDAEPVKQVPERKTKN